MKVRCIDERYPNVIGLKKGEEYEVIEETAEMYSFIEGAYICYLPKELFESVEPQKEEKKEYTVMELFEEKEGVVFNHADAYFKVEDGRLIRWFEGEEKAETVPMLRIYLFMKFTKVEEPKPVTTSEAMKALEEGKVVESCRGYQYKKEDDKICLYNKRRCASRSIDFEEIENQWIIIE